MTHRNLRILCVAHSAVLRPLILEPLRSIGFENVDEADSGYRALELIKNSIKKDSYQLIFSDWSIPDMSGFDFLKELRTERDFGCIPFIMLTSESEHEFVVEAIKAGATDYIIKPISPEVLERKIRRTLSILGIKKSSIKKSA